ncbi:MAG: HAD hydrolase family protein [Burkholderiaceae bacterium]
MSHAHRRKNESIAAAAVTAWGSADVSAGTRLSEAEFYASHQWCLNPILTIEALRAHVREAWTLLRATDVEWQRKECQTNLYLLLCGLSCTASDYLSYRPWPPKVLGSRGGRLSRLVAAAKNLANARYVHSRRDDEKVVRRWMHLLDRCVASICRVLVDEQREAKPDWSVIDAGLVELLDTPLPTEPAQWRMRIPEAFRCQDMTHHDVITMAENYVREYAPEITRPVFVVGPRTAGAYFVPLIHATFERSGFKVVGSLTIRPKEGLSEVESGVLRAAVTSGARLVIVDDHPNTGYTFQLIIRLLQALGASPGDLVILAPDHAAQTDYTPALLPVRVVTLAPEQFHKARMLKDDQRLLQCVSELVGKRGTSQLAVVSDAGVDAINHDLASHYGDNFLVRQKRLFAVEETDDRSVVRRWYILAKSVGWGWLGYHAYVGAERLKGFVPRLMGFSDGMMFIEWVGDPNQEWRPASTQAIASLVPSYVAARVRLLPLTEDPTIAATGYRVTGRDRILNALRRPYGPILKNLARARLDRQLGTFAAPMPAPSDGRMSRENWVEGQAGLRKVDFEHHNFGGAEENIVDPAYDLAGAIYDLDLDAVAEDRMVSEYVTLTGDTGVVDRLILFKLRVGLREIDRAADSLAMPLSDVQHRDANLRFLAGRNFLTYHLTRHHLTRIESPGSPTLTSRVFFLDLDGVFDVQQLGFFPHTTPNGLRALRLLQSNGYSVVPNTGRPTAHVRHLCESYGLAAGIAEYGTVFVDGGTGRSELLIDQHVKSELEACGAAIAALPGVYLDPGYQALIRAYRYDGVAWVGLGRSEIEQVLHSGAFPSLDVIATSVDTTFIPKGIDKAKALEAIAARLGSKPEFTAAIGDSKQDLPILEKVDRAFLLPNGAADVRRLGRSNSRLRIIHPINQSGFLEAVLQLLEENDGLGRALLLKRAQELVRDSAHPLDLALGASDRSLWARSSGVFSRDSASVSRRPTRQVRQQVLTGS